MAQYRQSGTTDRFGAIRNNQDLQYHHSHSHTTTAAINGDQVSIGIRATQQQPLLKPSRGRRSKTRRISIGAVGVFLALALLLSLLAFFFLSDHHQEVSRYNGQDDDSDMKSDVDFLTNVTRMEKVLEFGKGSVAHGGDSRYWDRDDRRRDEDYNEDISEHTSGYSKEGSVTKNHGHAKNNEEKLPVSDSHRDLYNEAGRDELKMYEAEYEASLKHVGQSSRLHGKDNKLSDPAELNVKHEAVDAEDEYDDGIDSDDSQMEDYDNEKHDFNEAGSHNVDRIEISESLHAKSKDRGLAKDTVDASNESSEEELSLDDQISDKNPRRSNFEKHPGSKKKSKRRKFSGCEMKLLNSTSSIVEPIESGKFARFAMQYTATEEKSNELAQWEPKFAGHQNLQQREDSFLAHDKKINCGFVRGPEETPSTGFDLAEDDASYMNSCHIAVISCIFGNSDRLRTPMGKTISRFSRKNVCFVMFTDEITLRTLATEGQSVDRMGFIGVWRIVVIKNLPYSDMRRVGKIPKLLSHRLFPSARYSIWLDSKLRLQLDPLLILEYFLWRKGYEYAISNHYDRHCVWEEVAQNKKLNKYNHTVIDQQFAFYKADGLTKFNSSDPKKLLPSNVPEGSFIIRAHTPMSNLFSCLWFNEVERFTPRDQLSFAYTYQKLRNMNPAKPFHLNMFKDCERRAAAKLFRHRSEEKRNILLQATE